VSPEPARWPRVLAATLVALALASLAARSDVDDRPRPAAPREFLPGEGKAIADRACQICHSPMLVTQQAKDSTGWEKTLGQMEKWGVKLTPAEHDTLRGYLLARFGPRKTPAPRASGVRPDSARSAKVSSSTGTSP
jgi:mono/diheme cytochrome c family protein